MTISFEGHPDTKPKHNTTAQESQGRRREMKKQELIALMAASIYAARTSGPDLPEGTLVTEYTERAVLDAQFILEQVYRTVTA